ARRRDDHWIGRAWGAGAGRAAAPAAADGAGRDDAEPARGAAVRHAGDAQPHVPGPGGAAADADPVGADAAAADGGGDGDRVPDPGAVRAVDFADPGGVGMSSMIDYDSTAT